MSLRFVWDKRKATANTRKHGVTFEEAASVFGDDLSLTIADTEHSSAEEERFLILGRSSLARLLVVAFCERDGDTIRVISARRATQNERLDYERS